MTIAMRRKVEFCVSESRKHITELSNLDESFQVGFRSGYNAETALLSVPDFLRCGADTASILILLDLSQLLLIQ